MSESRFCCVFLLVTLLTEPSSGGTGTFLKYVCLEDSVPLFRNVSLTNFTNMSLCINDRITAKWYMKASIPHPQYSPQRGYEEKLYLDTKGTIWMRKVQNSDQARYTLSMLKVDTMTSEVMDVEIIVPVPPSVNCKPTIERVNTHLIAFLEVEDCGRPAASVYWLGNLSTENQTVMPLLPGKEAGTYTACIKGPSMMCDRNSTAKDHCSSFTIDKDIQSIEYLLYVIPGIAGIGVIVIVVSCFLRKYIHCPRVAGVSKLSANCDVASGEERLQMETLSQHYWTIVTNARGEFSTALERDIDVDLEEFMNPVYSEPIESDESINPSHLVLEELETYIHPFNSDPIEIETSYSDSVESEGYINPIHSEHTRLNEYLDPIPSGPAEFNDYIHPIPSDPVDIDGYIDSISSDSKGRNRSIDSSASHSAERDGCNDLIPSENLESDRYLDIIPLDRVDMDRCIDPSQSDAMELDSYIDQSISDPKEPDK